MTEAPTSQELPEDKAAVPTRIIEPRIALQDYLNEVDDLIISFRRTDDVLSDSLRKLAGHKNGSIMLGFSQRFPNNVCPGAPVTVVARLDEIAAEMNTLYQAGQLTRQKIASMEQEVRRLCY